jgi:hypothetical protein
MIGDRLKIYGYIELIRSSVKLGNRSNLMNKHLLQICGITTIALLSSGQHQLAMAQTASLSIETSPRMALAAKVSVSSPLTVVRTQLDALNRQNLNTSMDSIHPSSPMFQSTKEFGETLFKNYKLRFTLQNLVLESITADTAKVRFTQITRKISGPEFQNNRLTGVHTLKKHQGKWKIYDSKTIKIEYLDK